MYVLGLQIGHGSTAALLKDGEIIGIISEERPTRKKCAYGFPFKSIERVMELANIKGDSIDKVAVASVELDISEKNVHKTIFKEGLGKDYNPLAKKTKHNVRNSIQSVLLDYGIEADVEFYDHHNSHAASAYYTCRLRDPLIITADGYGDGYCMTANIEGKGVISRIDAVDKFSSIGRFYTFITVLLGFKALRHEGKITGLAAYGDPKELLPIFRKYLRYNSSKNEFQSEIIAKIKLRELTLKAKTLAKYICRQIDNLSWIDHEFVEQLRKDTKGYSREDISAAAQDLLEEVAVGYVNHWIKKTKKNNILLSGGVFANVKLNQRIHELVSVEEIYIHPAMSDEGLALGCAYLATVQEGISIDRKNLSNVYFGDSFSQDYVENILEKNRRKYHFQKYSSKRLAEIVAQDISEGKIVGLFTESMEYGPRALGARTILADPRDKLINDWLNKRLKRSEFMPFAPVVLEEYADNIFKNMKGARYTSEFMTITFDVYPRWISKIKGVVHVDGTARPQVIKRKTNRIYYDIIEEFRKITGIPVLVNTSFNMHEEPIIDSPENALRALDAGAVDYVVIFPYLVKSRVTTCL
jgi:carbamoyltransferase